MRLLDWGQRGWEVWREVEMGGRGGEAHRGHLGTSNMPGQCMWLLHSGRQGENVGRGWDAVGRGTLGALGDEHQPGQCMAVIGLGATALDTH
eukprot:145338-Chlamydomonas_euryale.AAC.2